MKVDRKFQRERRGLFCHSHCFYFYFSVLVEDNKRSSGFENQQESFRDD